ncbi:hypothetical protein ACFL1I_00245 [Candidatus Omnitrophota bacterium]
MRKRLKTFLIVILILIVAAYAARGLLFEQAKKLIKQNLERNLPCKLAIGKIRAGLLYGLVLEDLEISFPHGFCGLGLDIQVAEAQVDYNLWQHIFDRQQEDVRNLRLIAPKINFSYLENKKDSQPVGPEGLKLGNRSVTVSTSKKKLDLQNFALTLEGGQIRFIQDSFTVSDLQGKIIFAEQGLYFRDLQAKVKDNQTDALQVDGELSENNLSLTTSLDHLKLGHADILTNLVLDLSRSADSDNKIRGTLKTYGSVFNNRPFPEMSSSFEIHDQKLRIFDFRLGDNYNLRGIVNLSVPVTADLSLNFYQAELNELLLRLTDAPQLQGEFNAKEQSQFSGLINGLIKITGNLQAPEVEGYLEAKDGHFGDLYFISADINIKGRFPKIIFEDSRIFREDDSFVMDGELDFSILEQQDFVELNFEPNKGMIWQGWDITRRREDQLRMSKGVAEDIKITFDTYMEVDQEDYEDNYTNEFGIEYKVFGDKLIKLRIKKDEGILGLERRMKF